MKPGSQLSIFNDRHVRRSELSFAHLNPSKKLIREYKYTCLLTGTRLFWNGQYFEYAKSIDQLNPQTFYEEY